MVKNNLFDRLKDNWQTVLFAIILIIIFLTVVQIYVLKRPFTESLIHATLISGLISLN